MKGHKSIKFYTLFSGLLSFIVVFSTVNAQEYDDMYFNKSDRKKIKSEKTNVLAKDNTNTNSLDYNQAIKTTEVYSAKNINPEYIARYKATESNQVTENVSRDGYSSDDYFIENYNTADSAIGIHKNQIDYAALNKRDQMSYSNHSSNFSNPYWGRPSWRFSPYMSMGYGFGSPFYDPFYDPYMMGYGSGLTLGMSYGFGSGFYPSMSYGLAMSYGMGYNPWGGWGAYPYNPYRMRGYYGDPWGWGGPSYAYGGYYPYSGYGYGSAYGYSRPNYYASSSDRNWNRAYQPRYANRSAASRRISANNSENIRVSSADSKIRVPNRTTTASSSDGRISRDYSKTQNEYYRSSRSNTSSSNQRISTSRSNRNSFARSSGSSARYNSSSISNNRPSRLSNSSSGLNRSSSGRSSYTNYSSGSRNSSSYSPSRSSSGSSYNRSSYSSGSRSSYSSGSRSSSSGSSSRSSSGSSRSGRQ